VGVPERVPKGLDVANTIDKAAGAFALATSQIAVDSAEMPEGKDQC